MAILYTSDLHFGHRNVIGFDHRPFTDVEEMDWFLIRMWNQRVNPDDHVYIVGDLCFRNEKPAEWYLQKLRGHKHLIIGNHDRKTICNEKAAAFFESIDQLLTMKDQDRSVVLCHYPMAEWNGMYHGTWHVYGHIHAAKNEISDFMRAKERALNAGCMVNGYAPATLNEMIRMQKEK